MDVLSQLQPNTRVYDRRFATPLTPKSGELVQHHKGGAVGRKGKAEYEAGMAAAFRCAWEALASHGRMVIVFAHKDADTWETLVVAMILAGFTVMASWPIDTEMSTRSQAMGGVLPWPHLSGRSVVSDLKALGQAMQERVTERLRIFWDVGISGALSGLPSTRHWNPTQLTTIYAASVAPPLL